MHAGVLSEICVYCDDLDLDRECKFGASECGIICHKIIRVSVISPYTQYIDDVLANVYTRLRRWRDEQINREIIVRYVDTHSYSFIEGDVYVWQPNIEN